MGHGRLLVGLVEYYEASGDPRSLEVARRLGDFLVDHAARFNAATVREAFHDGAMAHGYICWTQNVEGLALLARATGEERYRAAALSIADGIERRPGQHAHGWFSSLRGLALLAEDDPALLPDLGRAWQSFADSQDLLWTGGPPEYFAPGIARDEGCASADWLRLNLALWRMTEDERYLLAAENGLFNAFFANQQPNGGFGHLRLSPRGFEYGATEAWWCCTLHGARTFPAIREAAFRAEGDALAYDLPVDGRGEAHGLVVEADAEPARDGRVRFRILEAPPEAIALRIRKPTRTAELSSTFGSTREPWLTIEREWQSGESFDVEYAFGIETTDGDGVTLVRRGPWTLGASEGADPALFNEAAAKQRFNWQALAPADSPSHATGDFDADSFGGQTARTTLRPIAERWESGEHGLRWTTRFGAPGKDEPQSKAARYAKPAAAGFAVGVLLMALWMWRLRRRPAER
ncbi:MAG: glycoside hydrolase family 127 protein [Bryobacterales bacterium]